MCVFLFIFCLNTFIIGLNKSSRIRGCVERGESMMSFGLKKWIGVHQRCWSQQLWLETVNAFKHLFPSVSWYFHFKSGAWIHTHPAHLSVYAVLRLEGPRHIDLTPASLFGPAVEPSEFFTSTQSVDEDDYTAATNCFSLRDACVCVGCVST